MLKKIIFQFLALSLIFTYSAQSAESGGMPQLNPEFWISQIFWLVLTFGLLFIILSKFILPKISNNLETRKSQILENIETEKKVKEFDKIINDTKVEAKNFFNSERQKVLDDINNKRLSLEKDIEKEIIKAEEEIDQLKKNFSRESY
jgi:F-type H+-transporting ATPase subunit b